MVVVLPAGYKTGRVGLSNCTSDLDSILVSSILSRSSRWLSDSDRRNYRTLDQTHSSNKHTPTDRPMAYIHAFFKTPQTHFSDSPQCHQHAHTPLIFGRIMCITIDLFFAYAHRLAISIIVILLYLVYLALSRGHR